MNWNIFKRVAELEQEVKDLKDFTDDHSRWLLLLQEKVKQIENKLFIQAVEHKAFNVDEPVFTKDKVDEELQKKRQYKRDWYAKKVAKIKQEKNAQAVRERKNAYARAYYARTKGAKK
jgi:hypothetical protein